MKMANRANKNTFQELPQITIDKLAEPPEGKRANKKKGYAQVDSD